MNIRIARAKDIDNIMDIYTVAKQYMQTSGNNKQWVDGYPSRELIMNNILDKCLYLCTYDEDQIAGVFYFKVEDDKTYANISDGKWLNDKPYGVVHRLASNQKRSGVAGFCLQWCFTQCNNIRVDTHRDNIVMQNILKKNGYTQCGIIFIANGTERLAFQKC